jgi:hypothetical protein
MRFLNWLFGEPPEPKGLYVMEGVISPQPLEKTEPSSAPADYED